MAHHHKLTLSSSSSRSSSNNIHRKKKKQHKKNGQHDVDMDGLLKGMGLKPVGKGKQKAHENSAKLPLRTPTSLNSIHATLDRPAVLPLKTQLQYARRGHAVLRDFIPGVVEELKLRSLTKQYHSDRELEAWMQRVEATTTGGGKGGLGGDGRDHRKPTTVKECRNQLSDDVPPPFLQHFHLRRRIPEVDALARSVRLASAASVLMDVPTVRLYQDSLFVKGPRDGPTPWHSDARMAPFDTNNMLTFWIGLQPVFATGLQFVDRSHADFALPYWHGDWLDEGNNNGFSGVEDVVDLWDRYGGDDAIVNYMPLSTADVTVHAGWTLHGSDGGKGGTTTRYALALTYVDGRAPVRDPNPKGDRGHAEDRRSYRNWIDRVTPGRSLDQYKHDDSIPPLVWPIPHI